MDVTVQSPTQRRLNNVAFALMLVCLPALVVYANIALKHYDGAMVLPDAAFLAHIAAPSAVALLFYAGWFGLQVLLSVVLPGRMEAGVPLENGESLPYKLNGLAVFVVTLLLAVGLCATDVVRPTYLYDELESIVLTANLYALAVCCGMYVIGRSQASAGEKLRNPLEAYVMGATLNPRTGSFDWKFFCESRPGMILWLLVNGSCAAAQHAQHGAVSNAMWLVCLFQAFYVADYFVNEEAILTTWDIRHEPFGFMLCWGVLVWIPFTFSFQALYLVGHPDALSPLAATLICALNFTGYAIFRGANLQKHKFRKYDSTRIWGKPAEFIATARGTKLLISGFWGISRHSNYLGDLMMGLAWCLTTGSSRILAYFYFIYFVILLVHRERRDNDHCARKYGADWDAYTARVRWRILPFVY
jgi:hypothetical protein